MLCKRKWENDYDGVYSFIGWKMERTDNGLLSWLQREKNEEIWSDIRILIYPDYCTNVYFEKKDGNAMVLPHYYAEYIEWTINLNEEYSDFKWVQINQMGTFQPIIPWIPDLIDKILKLKSTLKDSSKFII